MAEQRIQVAELHAHVELAAVPLPRGVVPGDVGDGVRAQERPALAVMEHFADEAVGAAGDGQQRLQQTLERLALVFVFYKERQGAADGFQHAVLPVERVLRMLHLGHVRGEAVPEHRPVRLALGYRLHVEPAHAGPGQMHAIGMPDGGQVPRRHPQRLLQRRPVSRINPLEQDAGVLAQHLRVQFEQVVGRIVDVGELAAAVDPQAGLVDQPGQAGRDLADEMQLVRYLGRCGLLGCHVHHHAEIGFRHTRHRKTSNGRAKPARAAIRVQPPEVIVAFVPRLARGQPFGYVIGMDQVAPMQLFLGRRRRTPGQARQPRRPGHLVFAPGTDPVPHVGQALHDRMHRHLPLQLLVGPLEGLLGFVQIGDVLQKCQQQGFLAIVQDRAAHPDPAKADVDEAERELDAAVAQLVEVLPPLVGRRPMPQIDGRAPQRVLAAHAGQPQPGVVDRQQAAITEPADAGRHRRRQEQGFPRQRGVRRRGGGRKGGRLGHQRAVRSCGQTDGQAGHLSPSSHDAAISRHRCGISARNRRLPHEDFHGWRAMPCPIRERRGPALPERASGAGTCQNWLFTMRRTDRRLSSSGSLSIA